MTISEFVRNLYVLADCIEKVYVSDTGPYQLLQYPCVIDGVNCVFRMLYSPYHVRLRAEKLEKYKPPKGDKRSLEVYRAINQKKPTSKQSRFSNRIANQFLQDGELMNYHNYIGLYT